MVFAIAHWLVQELKVLILTAPLSNLQTYKPTNKLTSIPDRLTDEPTGCPKKKGDLCSELVLRCLEASNQKSLEG